MYTIFSEALRQQRKSDVMTSIGHSAHSAAPSIMKQVPQMQSWSGSWNALGNLSDSFPDIESMKWSRDSSLTNQIARFLSYVYNRSLYVILQLQTFFMKMHKK
jgi:hypothetical protein